MSITSNFRDIRTQAVFLPFAFMWLVPFCMPGHFVPLLTFWQEWAAAVLLLIVIFGLLLSRSDILIIQAPQIIWAPLGLALVIVLQLLMHRYSFIDQLLVPIIYLLMAGLACALGRTLAEFGLLERISVWIAAACVLGGVFSVGVQLAQVLGAEDQYSFMSKHAAGQPFFANLNQANHLAAYLAMALGSVLYLRLRKTINDYISWAVSILLTLGLVLSGQRCALIYVFVPLVITLLAYRSLPNHRRFLLGAGLALPVLFGVFYCAFKPIFVSSTVHLYAAVNGHFYDNRWLLLRHAWAMFELHPWLGVGFSQFWATYVRQVGVIGASEVVMHPHNVVAALMAETGIAGTLVVLAPLAIWAWNTRLKPTTIVQWFAWIQIAIVGLYSLIEFPLWYTYWLIIAAFWLGALDPISKPLNLRKPRLLAAAFFFGISVVLMDITFSYLKLRDMVLLPPPAEKSESDEFAEYRKKAFLELSHHWFFQSQASIRMASYLVKLDTDHLDEKLAFNERALSARPSSTTLQHQIVLLVLKGDIDTAIYWTGVTKILYPERYDQMAAEWPSYARQWPEQFNQNVIDRLTHIQST